MTEKENSDIRAAELNEPAFWDYLEDACFLVNHKLEVLATNTSGSEYLENRFLSQTYLTQLFKPADSYEYFEFRKKLDEGSKINDGTELFFDNGKRKITFFNHNDGNLFVIMKRVDWSEQIAAMRSNQTLIAAVIIVLCEPNGTISSSNLRFNELFEIQGRATGLNFFKLLQRKGVKVENDNLFELLNNPFETPVVQDNGQTCWIRWKVKKESFADKLFLRITGRDVSESVAIKNELKESKQRFQDIANVQGQFIWETDENFNIRFISPFIETVSGYKPGEIVGKSILSFFEENQQTRIHKLLKESGNSPGINSFTTFQHRIIDKSGNAVWLSSSGHKIEGSHKEFLGLRGISVDISRQKTEISKLVQSERRYELLFRQTPIGVFYYDNNLRVIETNETFQEIIGFSVDDIVGTDLRKLNDKRILPAVLSSIEGEQGEYEGDYFTANGKRLFIKLKCVPFYGTGNNVSGGIGLMEDISKANKAKEALKFQIDLEALALNISTRLINVEKGLIEEKINDALKRLGEFTCADRSYLLLTDDNLGKVEEIYIWCSEGTESDKESLKGKQVKDFSLIYNCIKKKKNITVTDVTAERKLNEVEKNHLKSFQIKSLLLVPLTVENEFQGLIGFDHCKDQKRWKRSEILVLQQIAHSFASLLQRQNMEKKLRQSEERFRSLVFNASDLITIFNTEGQLIYNSPSFERTLGYALSEDKQHSFRDLIHPEDLTIVLRAYAESIKSPGKVICVEFRIKRFDGSYANFESMLSNQINNSAIRGFVVNSRDITERVESEKQIKELLAKNKLLLGEIHHRVKNNLAVVTGLLSLQAESLESNEAKAVLKESEMRVRSMAMIHQKLYQADTYSGVEFSSYIKDLIKSIGLTYDIEGNVRILLNMDNLYLSLDKAIPCGLIINELLTNAYKHAFKNIQNPEISVSMTKCDNIVSLIFADNGTGFPEDFKFDETTSLGTQLITGLSQQLSGNFSFENKKGTTFTLNFEDSE